MDYDVGDGPVGVIPPSRVLRDQSDVCVARCVLGLTLYTRHRSGAAAGPVVSLLRAFLEVAPLDHLILFRTALLDAWKRIRPNEIPMLIGELANERGARGVRHLFGFYLADAADAPETFFTYRESDEARGPGAGYVQLGLPVGTPPDKLASLAAYAAEHVEMWCGVGGYLGSPHPADVPTSFNVFYAWARRYIGIDLQDPERARQRVHGGLPSTGWLTLVGRELAEKLPPAAFDAEDCPAGTCVTRETREQALLVRAGPAPLLGDLNTLALPLPYLHAARAVAPLLLETPTRLYGGFWEEDRTMGWARRFLDPQGWSQ